MEINVLKCKGCSNNSSCSFIGITSGCMPEQKDLMGNVKTPIFGAMAMYQDRMVYGQIMELNNDRGGNIKCVLNECRYLDLNDIYVGRHTEVDFFTLAVLKEDGSFEHCIRLIQEYFQHYNA